MQCLVSSWDGCERLRKMNLHCAVQKTEVKNTGGVLFPKKKNTQEVKNIKEKERTELGEKNEERDGGRKRVEDLKWWRNEEGKSLQKRKEKTEGGRPKKK